MPNNTPPTDDPEAVPGSDAASASPVALQLARKPRITVMDINYLHLRLHDASDLYITDFGLPFSKHLLPENHYGDRDWFLKNRIKLPGTSTVYRIATKEVDGRSIDIVLKWNRMGQDIPGETQAADLNGAEFNSPFEEFSLAIELRNTSYESPGRILTHKPLAIYVPRSPVEASRMGRRRYKIDALNRRHDEITLHINRQYAVIYEWVKGIDAADAFLAGVIDQDTMEALILRSTREMSRKGFHVRDSKPHHIIVRPKPEGGLVKGKEGEIAYAMVDFELLERTPQREQAARAAKRKRYLVRQANRFEADEKFPPDLTPVNIMGVDYVHGPVESTTGTLWVVGKDPVLFDYFLPEKWRRTPRTSLSAYRKVYYTVTKDSINLVWQVSRVGQRPDEDPATQNGREIHEHGYNSPFEEIAYNIELARNGIKTTYPRAIYMTRHSPETMEDLVDNSRYESHEVLTTPEGHPILSRHHVYIILWGYWNGPDRTLAVRDEALCRAINASEALAAGHITGEIYERALRSKADRLTKLGIEDLALTGTHLLLSKDPNDKLMTDEHGIPPVRLCSFELLRRTT